MSKPIAIRVDSAPHIGTGHFVRCLTLANALKACGFEVFFFCRQVFSNQMDALKECGHNLELLPAVKGNAYIPSSNDPFHAEWLRVSATQDAEDCLAASKAHGKFQWLLVDHYALDYRWEEQVKAVTDNLLVIDDLADRRHCCDILVDQNLYTILDRYTNLVSCSCRCLLGPRYTILREEFIEARQQARPKVGDVTKILVFLGGTDPDNITATVLQALGIITLPSDVMVDVIVGANNTWRSEIHSLCLTHGWNLHVEVSDMAKFMIKADMAIGAAGTVTWERFLLGLPSIVLGIADNQRKLLQDCAAMGYIFAPKWDKSDPKSLGEKILSFILDEKGRAAMSQACYNMVDGQGVSRILREMAAFAAYSPQS